MSSIQELPKIFTDRCLGKKVPEKLRRSGLDVITIAEYYEETRSKELRDEEWLKMVGIKGWIAFTKDRNISRNSREKQTLIEHKVKCFCVANQNLDGEAQANRFLDNLDSIRKASLKDGPMFYSVNKHGIRAIDLGLG